MEARYHPFSAALHGVANGLIFVAAPVAFLRYLPVLLASVAGFGLPEDLSARLQALEALIVPLGIAVAALAGLAAFFSKGLLLRAAFGVGKQGARLAWIFFVLNGGLFALALGGVALSVDFSRLLYFVYASIGLMAAYAVGEFLVYRHRFWESQMGGYGPGY